MDALSVLYVLVQIPGCICFSLISLTAVILLAIKTYRTKFQEFFSSHTILMALICLTALVKAINAGYDARERFGSADFGFYVILTGQLYIIDSLLLTLYITIGYIWFRTLCQQRGIDTKPATNIAFILGTLVMIAGIILWFGWTISALATGDQRRNSEDLWQNKLLLRVSQMFFTGMGYSIMFLFFTTFYVMTMSESKGWSSELKKYNIVSIILILAIAITAFRKFLDFFGMIAGPGFMGTTLRLVSTLGGNLSWITLYITLCYMCYNDDDVYPTAASESTFYSSETQKLEIAPKDNTESVDAQLLA